ncbi:hypothetical protein BASA61_010139 [Batrachochytrium salamandrivorans]|nr:hypothetical protein BASA61_010139 [Batrachochytrium salamandrivorans]
MANHNDDNESQESTSTETALLPPFPARGSQNTPTRRPVIRILGSFFHSSRVMLVMLTAVSIVALLWGGYYVVKAFGERDSSAGPHWGDPSFYHAHSAPALLLGDSLTAYALGSGGWVSLLASEFAGKHDVLDRGYPGYHTRQWLELLAPVFRDSLRPGVSPALITLLLGTNDAYTMSVDEYSLNLAKIVSEIKDEYPHAPFVMFTPPPTVHTTFLKASTVVLYRNAWLKVAQDFRINYIDLWKEVFPSVQGEFVFNRDYNSTIASPYFVQDGVHLSDAGNGMVYSSLKRLLQTVYPDIYS